MTLLLCGGCQARGACQFGVLEQTFAGATSQGRIACPASFEGLPGIAHGGWIAGAFDDVMGRAAAHIGGQVHTTTLTIDFLKPVPVEQELRFTVLATDLDNGWSLNALLLQEPDRPLARAAALFKLPRSRRV